MASYRCERKRVRAALPICALVPLCLLSGASCYLTGSFSFPSIRRLTSRGNSVVQTRAGDGSKDEPYHFGKKTAAHVQGSFLSYQMKDRDEIFSESTGPQAALRSVKVAAYCGQEVQALLAKENQEKGDLVFTPTWRDRTFESADGSKEESKSLEMRHHFMKVSSDKLSGSKTQVAGKAPTKKIAELLVAEAEKNGVATLSCVGANSVMKGLTASIAAGQSMNKKFAVLPKRYKEEVNGDDVNVVDLHFVVEA
eukprot:TRINITY_DN366_c0_g1_i3.p1 TRINITY_DN366_c0_g1~~TRINITY_DN366_c0_g1_i3.p1  ORF type:complete len:253 (+),score=80.09 TRINITY_DN366_c0_g1_i3:81-839(+)